jgi:hypothetical protein
MTIKTIRFHTTISHGGNIVLWRGTDKIGVFENNKQVFEYIEENFGRNGWKLN